MDSVFDSRNQLTDQLINRILIVTAISTFIAFCSAEFRAVSTGIGWSYRDLIQLVSVSFVLVLTFLRDRLQNNFKAISLIAILSMGGFSGANTLGILGGTVWLFPTALVIVTIFYSKLATKIYIGFIILFFIILAIRFCTEKGGWPFDAQQLLSSPYHWCVYILCIATFFIVGYVTIQNYRAQMNILINKIGIQNDDLEKSNESLLKALRDVKTLSGLLPICMHCKKIRDDKGYWNKIENFIHEHSEVEFSHGICQECAKKYYPDMDLYDEDGTQT